MRNKIDVYIPEECRMDPKVAEEILAKVGFKKKRKTNIIDFLTFKKNKKSLGN